MLVYISHPYQNDETNKTMVEGIVNRLSIMYPHHTFVSPIHAYGFMYDKVPYLQGLRYCLDLLGVCDLMLVAGDDWEKSNGVSAEIGYCIDNDINFHVQPSNKLLDWLLGGCEC